MAKNIESENYVLALRDDQWDFILLALRYVLERAQPKNPSYGPDTIDVFGRRLVRRRLKEIIAEIENTVPDAGSEALD